MASRTFLYPSLLFLFSSVCMSGVQPELTNHSEHSRMKEKGAVLTSGEFQQHFLTEIHSELVELRLTVSSLKDRLQITEEKLKQLKGKGDSENCILTEHTTAFAATLGHIGNFGSFNTDITLVYKKVLVNKGRAYNPATGIFSAPVKGIYFFTVSGLSHSSKIMDLRLFKNEQQIMSVYNGPLGDRYESTSYSVCLNLEEGDHVYVRLLKNTWVYDNENDHNAFVGHLLFPL